MRRLFALLLVLMLALPAAAAPCAPAPAATHHAMSTPASHDAPAGCAERLHGCIGCAAALRTPDLAPARLPDAAGVWASWTPAAPAGLSAIPAIPPPRLG